MKRIMQLISRMVAVMLAGTLAMGSLSVSAFGAEDAGSTAVAAEEFALEEATEDGVSEPSSAEIVDEEVMPEPSSAEVVNGEGVSESPDATFADTTQIAAEEDAVTSYTVTLDANGGYFSNEWDDVLNEALEKTEVLNKIVPVGGMVSVAPVKELEGTTATFLGWSLERDGEILPQEQEGYAPVGDCVLFAVWKYDDINDETTVYDDVTGSLTNEDKLTTEDEFTTEDDYSDDIKDIAEEESTYTIGGVSESAESFPMQSDEPNVTTEESVSPSIDLKDEAYETQSSTTENVAHSTPIDEYDPLSTSTTKVDTKLGWKCKSEFLVNNAGIWLGHLNQHYIRDFYKQNDGYAIAVFRNLNSEDPWVGPVLISTVPEYVSYRVTGDDARDNIGYDGTYDYLGMTWYINAAWHVRNTTFTSPFTVVDDMSNMKEIFDLAGVEFYGIDLSNATLTLPSDLTCVYNGSKHEPNVTVTLYGKILEKDIDYTISYSDNVNAGNAKITVTGKGKYTGTATSSFVITEAPSLDYLEVGINGDVTVHWKAPANTSFIKGYRVRHRIVGSTNWMTTDISGSTSTNVILRNLAVNDYEIKICSIMLSDGNEIESSYSKAARCPVPKIEIINPVSGTMFADSYALNLIMGLGHEAKYTGKGGIRVYDSDNKIVFSKKLSGEDDGTRKLDVVCSTGYTWNDKKASDPQEILKPNNYYHVSIDEKSIQYIENEYETFQVPIYFSGIKKTEDTWKFKTVKQSYPGVINPNGHKINEQFYHLLFGDGWKDIYGEDDGSNGHCFGLSYVVGAYEYNFNNLKEVTTGYSKLSDVPINSQSKLMEYVMIAHLIQADSEYKASRYKKNDKAYELYNAVKSGRNVLVNMNCSGGNHTIYTLGIIDDSDESNIQIAVYDSSFPTINFANNQYGSYRTFVPTLILKKGLTKNNWKFEYKTNMYKDFTLSSFVEVDSKYDSRITDIATIAHNNSISKSTIANLVTKTYTGKAITQKPVVKFNSTILKINTDYTVSYKKNINAGIATLVINGKGDYAGTKTATFKINRASIAKATVSCPASKVWAGWAMTPVPTVKVGSKTLKKGTDFSLAYKNNKNVGTATITITGKGNYIGTIKKTFKINPKPTSISKLSGGSRNFTIGWKKQASQTSGYQIQYSSRSDFKTQKIMTVSGASKTSRTLSGLAKKHKYYVRIRTYKTVGKTKYYSTWSAAKTVTTK